MIECSHLRKSHRVVRERYKREMQFVHHTESQSLLESSLMTGSHNFHILKISGKSDLPLRNSHDDLILGSHVLWDHTKHAEHHNSLSPNIFAHDFTSPIASTASLNITIKTSHHFAKPEHKYRLCGSIGRTKIIESDCFVPSQDETNVIVKVVQPEISNRPFAWNGDVTWTLENKQDSTGIIGHHTHTHLELYWISKDIHEIFLGEHPGIPVELLRIVIPNLALSGLGLLSSTTRYFDPYNATNLTFYHFSKRYDTTQGKPRFGVNDSGGTFNYSYYIQAAPGGQAGSLQRLVNCYDQGAMMQVVESFGHVIQDRPSWLYLAPYGYILPTSLVGVPGICNNPFFMFNGSPQNIGVDDPRRTAFGNHVFNGILPLWDPNHDRIFDACGGPHTGDDPQMYVDTSIDRITHLYSPPFRPGTPYDIVQYAGVTNTTRLAPFSDIIKAEAMASKGVERLIKRAASHQPRSSALLQNHWDDVPSWVRHVAGHNSSIAFHSDHFGNGGETVHELWHLSGVAHGIEGGDLVLQINVHTSVSSSGTLDLQRASVAALDNLRYELKNTDMYLGPDDELLNTLWEPSPVGQEYSQYAMQLSPNVPRGHMLIVSGNTIISLYGGSSSASLEPLVRRLLSHTTISHPISLSVPKESSHRFNIPIHRRGSEENIVKGVGTSFTIRSQVPHPISIASAIAKDSGVLLKNYTIEHHAEESTIIFEFVTFKIGTHDVDIFFARTHMLTGGKKSIKVVVEEAD